MIVAVSEDGFITNGSDPNPGNWTSIEDKKHYQKYLHEYSTYFMGLTTYRLSKSTLPKGKQIIVWTNEHTASLEATTNITFLSTPMEKLEEELGNESDKILLLGGASVYRQFLEAGKINDIWLTIEPKRFKEGVRLFTQPLEDLNTLGFRIDEEKTVNQAGTKIIHLVALAKN